MSEIRMKIPERDILRACEEYLLLRGHFVYRVNTACMKINNRFIKCVNINGTADLQGITKNGIGLQVECKSAKGKQTKEQKAVEKNYKERGALYIVARGIEDLQGAGL